MYVYDVMYSGSLNLRLHFLKMNQEFCGQKNNPPTSKLLPDIVDLV